MFMKFRTRKKLVHPDRYVVLISGCDTGLGFSLASHCQELGLSVLAGCLDKNSEGAVSLQERGAHLIELDFTDYRTIQNALEETKQYLQLHPEKELGAVVNNAAVMCFGEFEWLTKDIIDHQIQVNFTGTLHFTNTFCSLVRESKGRIINITSHCADACLPGLSVYGATKAALKAWNDALRIELSKFDVRVISFLPGAFFGQSNILANQRERTAEMEANMPKKDLQIYEDYFKRYFNYIHSFSLKVPARQIENEEIYEKFTDALLAENPYPHYKISPFKYSFYHFLFKVVPTKVKDKLVERFINMPRWNK